MKTSTLIIGGLVVLGGLGMAMAMGGDETSGVTIDGECNDFTITDWNAWNAQSQVTFKQLWEDGVRDPHAMIVAAWKAAIPQCEWPPKAGTAARAKWDANIDTATQFIQQLINQLEAAASGATPMTIQGVTSVASQAARRIGAVFGVTVTTATLAL